MQNLSVFISDFTKDFAVVFEAFVGEVTVDFVSGDMRNSFCIVDLSLMLSTWAGWPCGGLQGGAW